jgi:prepilin-type N-terminal cleavage/methylation domain-containing protein
MAKNSILSPLDNNKSGFTLVELSIVLLIIGLIIGGITAGSSLIKQAQIRSVISEITNLKTAIFTFKVQYNYLPGDFPNAGSFWSGAANCANSSVPAGCNGNANGMIDRAAASASQGYEQLRVWQHLSLSGLIAGNYTGISTIAGQADIGINVPASKLSPGGYYIATEQWAAWTGYTGYTSIAARTYIDLGGFNAGNDNFSQIATPIDAYNLDNKMDDGLPSTGTVLSYQNSGNTCVIISGSNVTGYNVTSNLVACNMGFSIGM